MLPRFADLPVCYSAPCILEGADHVQPQRPDQQLAVPLANSFAMRCCVYRQGHGRATDHKPELILNNFGTRLGRRVGRMFASLFCQVSTTQLQLALLLVWLSTCSCIQLWGKLCLHDQFSIAACK